MGDSMKRRVALDRSKRQLDTKRKVGHQDTAFQTLLRVMKGQAAILIADPDLAGAPLEIEPLFLLHLRAGVGGREVASLAEQNQNLRQVIECIPSLRPRAFQGQLSLEVLGGLTGPKVPAPELRWTFEELAEASAEANW